MKEEMVKKEAAMVKMKEEIKEKICKFNEEYDGSVFSYINNDIDEFYEMYRLRGDEILSFRKNLKRRKKYKNLINNQQLLHDYLEKYLNETEKKEIINYKNNKGIAILHYLVRNDYNYKTVELFLKLGANVDIRTNLESRTPLMYAVENEKNEKNVKLLLENGANPFLETKREALGNGWFAPGKKAYEFITENSISRTKYLNLLPKYNPPENKDDPSNL